MDLSAPPKTLIIIGSPLFLGLSGPQMVKNLLPRQETWVQTLGQEDPLEKEMATHSSILAWRLPWTEEPGGQPCMGSQSQTRLSGFTSLHQDVCLHRTAKDGSSSPTSCMKHPLSFLPTSTVVAFIHSLGWMNASQLVWTGRTNWVVLRGSLRTRN